MKIIKLITFLVGAGVVFSLLISMEGSCLESGRIILIFLLLFGFGFFVLRKHWPLFSIREPAKFAGQPEIPTRYTKVKAAVSSFLLAVANLVIQILFWNSPFFQGGFEFSQYVRNNFVGRNAEPFYWGTAIWGVLGSLVMNIVLIYYFYRIIQNTGSIKRKCWLIISAYLIVTFINAIAIFLIGVFT